MVEAKIDSKDNWETKVGYVKDTLLTKARYDKASVRYDYVESPLERLAFHKWRKLLWSRVKGSRILEVGVGTGKNFPYYPEGAWITAVDLSDGMLAQAYEKKLRDDVRVDLYIMDGQALAFRDHTFDAVVATFVFCSVPDPIQGLREVARVLKPGGKVYLLEHMLGRPPLSWMMNLMNPIAVRLNGENINRRTLENIEKAGLKIKESQNLFLDVFKLVEAEP